MIIGTSHAGGSFQNNDTSIPLDYCIDRASSDTRIAHERV
jgi:hypothetical protein